MGFYANVFDPKLVIAQIIAMQCLAYLSLSGLLWMSHELFATPLTLTQIFSIRLMGWDTRDSAAASAAAVLNGLFIGVELSVVVERAKKCLDFAVTFYFIHLIMCCRAEGFPTDWRWWVVNIGGLILAALTGEYLCMKKELREIDMDEFLSMRPVRTDTGSPPPVNNIQKRQSSKSGSASEIV